MADVGQTQGPSGGPEPLSGIGKKKPPGEDFKKILKKVEKVREVDPEEQRKRRERAEKPEENLPDEAPLTPKEQVAPFSLEEPEKKISPLELQSKEVKPSPLQAFETSQPSLQRAAFSPSESQEETITFEPTEETASTPSQPPAATPSLSPAQSEAKPTEEAENIQPEAPPEKEIQKETPAKKAASLPLELESPKEDKTEEGKETFFDTFAGLASQDKKIEKKEETPLTIDEEISTQIATPNVPTPGSLEKEKEEALEAAASIGGTETTPLLSPESSTPPTPGVLPPYTYLHPQVLELFDRMVGVMTVMTTAGISETTISLTGEEFASSVFYGSQIIIREFSTAPKEFNIQINTSAQGATLFQGNVADLIAAFQSGNYNFRVNRLDVELREIKRPDIRRKEKAGDKGDTG